RYWRSDMCSTDLPPAGSARGPHEPTWPSVPDPRVDVRVQEVDEDADRDHHEREDADHALHRGVVAVPEVLHEGVPDTRPVEGRLRQHRTAEQERHVQADDGDHGHESVLERVVEDDRALGDAARTGGLDV